MTNEKTSKEAFKDFRAWHRAFLAADMKLPRGCGYSKFTLYAYCSAMAEKGTNGKGCYASDSVIARELGMSHRDYAAKYRRLAVELGWLKPTGSKRGRVTELDIAVPEPDVSAGQPILGRTVKYEPVSADDPWASSSNDKPEPVAVSQCNTPDQPDREPEPELPDWVSDGHDPWCAQDGNCGCASYIESLKVAHRR